MRKLIILMGVLLAVGCCGKINCTKECKATHFLSCMEINGSCNKGAWTTEKCVDYADYICCE